MAKTAKTTLRKATLAHNEKKERWELKDDATNRVIKAFDVKDDATKGGVLEEILGKKGGSVKIQKKDGKFQEERTYPGNADPASSKG